MEEMALENMKAYFNGFVSADGKHWRADITTGEKQAYYAYKKTRCEALEMGGEIEMDSFATPNPCDVPDFLLALRGAGVSTLIVPKCGGLMELIHALIENGATFAGPCVLERKPDFFGEVEAVPGLRFSMPA